MRDLTSEELVHVYGAGGCNPDPCKKEHDNNKDGCKEKKPKKEKCGSVSSDSCETRPVCG